jgi:hypothetical protein
VPARISSPRPRSQARGTIKALSPRSHSRRRSGIGLGLGSLPVDLSVTAKSCGFTIRCGAATFWPKCSHLASSIRKGSGSVSEHHFHATSALAGLTAPGRFGDDGGEPGLVITERIGLGLATVAARKGQADALRRAVASAYGVELPTGSRVAHGSSVSFIGYGPGPRASPTKLLPVIFHNACAVLLRSRISTGAGPCSA